MGLIAAATREVQGATVGVSGVDAALLPALGISEVAGIIVLISLLYLLASSNLIEAADADSPLKGMIIGLAIPLMFVFAGIVLYHSLEAIGLIGPS